MLRNKIMAAKALALVVVFASMSSFSGTWGGDSYRIYVNDKLVVEEFVYGKREMKNISLNEASANDQVSVYYSHCGKVGKGRHLAVKDGKQVLKEWKFADASDEKPGMRCQAKEIVGLKKNDKPLGLHYSSKEMPEGMMLAHIVSR